ncbi:SagB/ThcOx family dehydrogenase [Listeria monocytogenes]|nr:SagB/ThcOx family dehydrogenase [Listeria monocytogenes]
MRKIDDEQVFNWNPGYQWEVVENKVVVAAKEKEIPLDDFVSLYTVSQPGATYRELIEIADENIVKELINDNVLLGSLPGLMDVLSGINLQGRFDLDQETFIDPDKYTLYKDEMLSRQVLEDSDDDILLEFIDYPETITERRSIRKFSSNKVLSFNEFNTILSVLRRYDHDETYLYNYATDGGLYPLDIYLYIKDKKIEGVTEGLYLYDPIANRIKLVSKSCVVKEDVHFSGNKEIHRESAFTMFIFYNSQVTLPKYGGNAYCYAAIDTGIVVQLITTIIGNLNSVGLCSIGDINFKRIRKYFHLNEFQNLLHTIEVGKYE